jgi:hypothetical protein
MLQSGYDLVKNQSRYKHCRDWDERDQHPEADGTKTELAVCLPHQPQK